MQTLHLRRSLISPEFINQVLAIIFPGFSVLLSGF
jgi:hypothetical protein